MKAEPFVVVTLSTTPVEAPNLRSQRPDLRFPDIHLSLADKLGTVQLVVWDQDMLTKEYLGEVALSFDDWFKGEEGSALEFDDPGNQVG